MSYVNITPKSLREATREDEIAVNGAVTEINAHLLDLKSKGEWTGGTIIVSFSEETRTAFQKRHAVRWRLLEGRMRSSGWRVNSWERKDSVIHTIALDELTEDERR